METTQHVLKHPTMLLSRNLTGVRVTTGMKQLAERLLERQELSKVETWQNRFSPTSRTCLKGKRISKSSRFERIHENGMDGKEEVREDSKLSTVAFPASEEVIQSAKARGKVGGDCTCDDKHYEPNMPFGQVYAIMMLRNQILLSYQHGQQSGTAFMQRNSFVRRFCHNLREVWSLEKYRDKQTERQLWTNAETHTAHVTRHYLPRVRSPNIIKHSRFQQSVLV